MSVKCPQCQFENLDAALFCVKCGTRFSSPEEVSISVQEAKMRGFFFKVSYLWRL
jgi:DNA-directed RNA polymerase subunit RPC12/RpoP